MFQEGISIIVPAYREEKTIVRSIESLVELQYFNYEIVVVDDGSTDGTSKEIINAFSLKPTKALYDPKIPCRDVKKIYFSNKMKIPIFLIQKENGGKGDALNAGINLAHEKYFICIDADSILQSGSLQKIIEPFRANPKTVAVGGRIIPQMEEGWAGLMQNLEYNLSFKTIRCLAGSFNITMIISGAFGIFCKDIVIQAGGYATDTVGEDMELVQRIRKYLVENKIEGNILYQRDAVCYTQIPISLKYLFRQRSRWQQGLFEVLWRYKEILYKRGYGVLIKLYYLYFVVFELLSPYLELIVIGLLLLYRFEISFALTTTVVCVQMILNLLTSKETMEGILTSAIISGELVGRLMWIAVGQVVYHYFISGCRLAMPVHVLYKKLAQKDMWGIQERRG